MKRKTDNLAWIKPNILGWGYLNLESILKNLIIFSSMTSRENMLNFLDLGCGIKPYESLFPHAKKFVGFDIAKNDNVDVVGVNWDLPFQDNEFDAVICTQVLEHTAKISETIAEIRRVTRNYGLVFVSAPLTYPEHGAPYDYFRFTKFGLRQIFSEFEIISITPQGGYFNTMFRLINTFLNYFPGAKYIFFPIYFINNCIALLCDFLFGLIGKLPIPILKRAYQNVYLGFPENYSIIIRNKK